MLKSAMEINKAQHRDVRHFENNEVEEEKNPHQSKISHPITDPLCSANTLKPTQGPRDKEDGK